MLRILYVDSDLPSRERATGAIWQLGYWNDVVASGKRALEACRRNSYDLVFINLAMTDSDGLATARQIRSLERSCGQPASLLCAISGAGGRSLRQACFEAGMEVIISNPASREELQRMIRLAETIVPVRAETVKTGGTNV